MDAIRRTSTLRRVATTASLAALFLIPASADAARGQRSSAPKSPVITSVSPLKAKVGQTLTIRGRHFRKGKGRNSVGFKRDGAPVVFIKSDVSTTKVMYVKLSAKLEKVLYAGTPARFHLRVLARRFGKQYTSNKLSPVIRPRPVDVDPGAGGPTGPSGGPTGPGGPAPAFDPAGPEGDCDGDKTLNKNESGDIDNDLLSDTLENTIGTNGCAADSDKDGVTDAYEHKSAIDLNEDEYGDPTITLPYPGKRPYPNALNADAATDYDGDSLTLAEEYDLWSKNPGGDEDGHEASDTFATFEGQHISYSDGLQYSEYTVTSGRRAPAQGAANYPNQRAFLDWAATAAYDKVDLPTTPWWTVQTNDVDILDFNRNGTVSTDCVAGLRPGEERYYDFDCDTFLSDDERDEDADGLTNYDEAHGRATPGYWESCYAAEAPYPVAYAGTSLSDPDSDDDGVLDGADDQDHDDLPNVMELSRMAASKSPTNPQGLNDTKGKTCTPLDALDPEAPNHSDAYGKVQPFDPCDPVPAPYSRTCERHPEFGTKADPNWWSLQ
jgi:hypothetical protein